MADYSTLLDFEEDTLDDKEISGSLEELEGFLAANNIKNTKKIPALDQASKKTKQFINDLCLTTAGKQRAKRIIELFKGVDWLPIEELDHTSLKKIDKVSRELILKDLSLYIERKNEKKLEQRARNQTYKAKVMQYFKQTMPKELKIELETLRDYELNLINHDRNWKHYFNLNSFKKIDDFITISRPERLKIYEKFKHDVHTYKKNKERNLFGEHCEGERCTNCWEEDIINSINWEKNKKSSKNKTVKASCSKENDFVTLGLPPNTTCIEMVRKKYRELALKYHPDRPTGDETKMKQIINAYQRLRVSLKNK